MDQTAVAEKALPGFPRSETMKKDIEHLILKSSEEESYDYFCETVVSFRLREIQDYMHQKGEAVGLFPRREK